MTLDDVEIHQASAPTLTYFRLDGHGDGCSDVEETMAFEPSAWHDFYHIPVPARQVAARPSPYRSDTSSPLSVTIHQLNIEPKGATTLAPGLFAVRGLSLRVVLKLVGIPDGNASNNVLGSLIP